jgi:Zn-dependent peptidase ImmA (M78 family)
VISLQSAGVVMQSFSLLKCNPMQNELYVTVAHRAISARLAEKKLLMPYEMIYLKLAAQNPFGQSYKEKELTNSNVHPAEMIARLLHSINSVPAGMKVTNLEMI